MSMAERHGRTGRLMGHAQFNPNNTAAMRDPTKRPEGGGNISQYITKPREVPTRLTMK
jgi:hypothetical protein